MTKRKDKDMPAGIAMKLTQKQGPLSQFVQLGKWHRRYLEAINEGIELGILHHSNDLKDHLEDVARKVNRAREDNPWLKGESIWPKE